MPSRNQLITALDIGTSSVKIAIVDPNFNAGDSDAMYVVAVGQATSQGMRKGVVINIDSTTKAISEAIVQAEEMLGDSISQTLLSISGAHLQGFNSHGVVGIKYKEVSHADLERVFEAARAVSIPFDREVVHILPQDYIIDGQSGIKEPLGISGVRLETSVHIVTGSTNSAQNLVKCANRCGLTVQDLIISGIASSFAVTSNEEREQGVCVVDIGAGTADLSVHYSGSIRHTAVLPFGGGHITNDLAAGLRTPILSAERLKCNYGVSSHLELSGDQKIEIASLGERANKVVSQSELVSIIEPRLTEILTMLKSEIDKTELQSMLTAGVVLTGGTSNMQGITGLAERIFEMPVRVGAGRNVQGLSDFVKDPEYAGVLGLISYAQSGLNIHAISSPDSFVKQSCKKLSNWIGEHF